MVESLNSLKSHGELNMNTQLIRLAFILGAAGALIACTTPAPTAIPIPPTATATATLTFTPQPTQTPSLTPTPSRTPTVTPRPYASAFGIDYGQPVKYLAQGGQTRLSNPGVIDTLRRKEQSIAHLGEIYRWIQRGFKSTASGGTMIGVSTVDQMLTDRVLTGCHDWGLMYASIARELGYPTVMVDATTIWLAKQFQSGNRNVPYYGHVFVEVFVEGKWILVDSTNNWYVETNYDPTSALIPLKAPPDVANDPAFGYYVMRKGIDTQGYGIRSNRELNRLQDEASAQIQIDNLKYPAYTFLRFK